MLWFKPLLAALLIIGATAAPPTASDIRSKVRDQSISDETTIWLLRLSRARLTGNQSELIAAQESMPLEATEPRERTTVFVTLYTRGCLICPPTAIGGGDTLAAALNSALSRIPTSLVSSGHTLQPRQHEPDRIQIDIFEGDWTPMAIEPRDLSPSRLSAVAATTLLDPGIEGLAIHTGGGTRYLLPLEMLHRSVFTEDPASQRASDFLSRAMKAAGLPAESWIPPRTRLSRFRTITIVEGVPNGSLLRIVRGSTRVTDLDKSQIVGAARAGGDYLVRMQQTDGSFLYSYDPIGDRANNRNYNMLRHAGAAMSLVELYNSTRDARYLESARKAVNFLKARFRPSDRRALYVLDYDGKAKLGGNGLALLALVNLREAEGQTHELDLERRLANQILAMQRRDGSFQSYHRVRGDEPEGSVSLYYPGEAILGLLRLYGVSGDKRLLTASRQGADYLVTAQQKVGLPPDAWLMQALEALFKLGREPRYSQHLFALAEAMMSEQYPESAPAGYAGGFRPGLPRATPAASRAEGLLAAYRVAASTNDPRASRIASSIKASARFQLSQQFNSANGFFLTNPERASGGFRASMTSMRIRIDFVQHNISSLLGTAQALY